MIRFTLLIAITAILLQPGQASAADVLCDTAHQDCREPLLRLIRDETVAIDVAFWFMRDTRYASELERAKVRGVQIRVLMDTRANAQYPDNIYSLEILQNAGIPMREKIDGGILHWKMMLFAGQNTVQFSGANYSPEAFVPNQPWVDYVDEVIYFTDQPSLVNSFKTKYDDVWTSPTGYRNYANVTTIQRSYPTFPIDPQLNFPPVQSFRGRSVTRYAAETQRIDSIMYRITDRSHSDQMIETVGRGVPVRVLSEPNQYRSEQRIWHSWNIDRMYIAGVQIRHRRHQGLNHEKLTLLHGQGMTIFGSSNWTSPSSDSQLEHNLFTTDPAFFSWSRDHFERKWNNLGPQPETEAFVPLPPDVPQLSAPFDGEPDQSLSVTLRWSGGPWAHKYDVFLGTDPGNLTRIVSDEELGPYDVAREVSGLAAGTTYYWKVVGRTMANVSDTSPTWSFTTAGGGPPPDPVPSPWSNRDIGSVGIAGSATYNASTSTFRVRASGADVWGAADAFHFVHQTLTGDGEVVARVATLSNTDAWTKAGVMLRASLTDSSGHASMFVSAARGLAFQRRTSTGAASTHTSGGGGTAPYWVKLARSGSTISAYTSTNGAAWTLVGTETMTLPSTIHAGLALTSHNNASLATTTFDAVAVTSGGGPPPPPPLPSGWANADIGAVAASGTSTFQTGTFTVRGSGADIWGSTDGFQFAYRSLAGNGTITARVATLQNVHAWTKAGVMIRAALTAGARHATMVVSSGKGLAFQRRVLDNGASTHTNGGAGTTPAWVRIQRAGSTVSAFTSTNGTTWTLVGTDTINLPATAYVGLAVTSHADGTLATATLDNVVVTQ